MSVRLVLVALSNIRNIGDAILPEVTAYLIRRVRPDAKIVRMQFSPGLRRGHDLVQRGLNRLAAFSLWLSDRMTGGVADRLRNVYFRARLTRPFRDAFRSVDAVVLAVGTFKYASQDHESLYAAVAQAAHWARRPLMLSAASVSMPDFGDWRAQQLRRALQRPCWRMLTTRDGQRGVKLLKSAYGMGKDVSVRAVGDPALWLPEMTGVVRAASAARGVVGVNLVRGGIYETYRGGVSEEQLLSFYGELLAELDRRGRSWILFSNGTRSDEKFGDLLCERYEIPPERRLPPPTSVRAYAETVASFRVIFGARLHACLTAAAFRVPSVWLDWDDKFTRVAETLGCARRLIARDELDGRVVADRLETLAFEPYDEAKIAVAKAATAESIAAFVRNVEERRS